MKITRKNTSQSIILVALLFPMSVFSASIFFETSEQSFGVGQEFTANVFLNTEEESINAIEGKIVFPTKLLEITEIRDGNSIVNFWVEKPHIVPSGITTFSGIIPGGVTGTRSFLFTLVFRTKTLGEGNVEFQNLNILKNDGAGTGARAKSSPLNFSVTKRTASVDTVESTPKDADTDPPEEFSPEIARTDEVFEGKYFLVFATQDKGSGIDHYEVREGFFGTFITTTSPYILVSQRNDQRVSVRAIDKKGNVRTENIYPTGFRYWGDKVLIFTLLVIVVLYIRRVSKNNEKDI